MNLNTGQKNTTFYYETKKNQTAVYKDSISCSHFKWDARLIFEFYRIDEICLFEFDCSLEIKLLVQLIAVTWIWKSNIILYYVFLHIWSNKNTFNKW